MWWLLTGATLAVADPVRALTSSMHERFDYLTKARDGVVAGDLEATKTAAHELSSVDAPESLPPGWLSFVAAVNVEAVVIQSAPDLPTAAHAVAQASIACGGCHAFAGKGPDLRKARLVPPQVWEPGSNMQLHAWSLSWMWLGLIASDDAACERGAQTRRTPADSRRWMAGARRTASPPRTPACRLRSPGHRRCFGRPSR